MNAYNHIITSPSATRSSTTRNKHGISLPFIPGISEVEAEPQQVRKVTVLPATIRKVMQPKDAPAPTHKPHTFYTEKRKSESFERWVARDWALRVQAERPAQPKTGNYWCNSDAAAHAGRKSVEARRQSPEYIESRNAIVAAVAAAGEMTASDIRTAVGAATKGALSDKLPALCEEGRLTRKRVKNVYIYSVPANG